jgi:hypothetical protein
MSIYFVRRMRPRSRSWVLGQRFRHLVDNIADRLSGNEERPDRRGRGRRAAFSYDLRKTSDPAGLKEIIRERSLPVALIILVPAKRAIR